MVRRGNGCLVVRMLHETKDVAGRFQELQGSRIVKPLRPFEGSVWPVPLNFPQVVYDIPAGNYHNPPVPKGREFPTQLDVIFERLQRVDRQLNDWDVRGWGKVGQHAPGPVIETPLILVQTAPDRLDFLGNLGGNIWSSRRRIIEFK